jgi:hypothetical protein
MQVTVTLRSHGRQLEYLVGQLGIMLDIYSIIICSVTPASHLHRPCSWSSVSMEGAAGRARASPKCRQQRPQLAAAAAAAVGGAEFVLSLGLALQQ